MDCRYERVFGAIAGDVNFTVTNEMKVMLKSEYGITYVVPVLGFLYGY